MSSRIYHPPLGQGRDSVTITLANGRTYTFMPGVARHVPKEDDAAVVTALKALQGLQATATAPAVTPTLGAAGSYTYEVVAFNANGDGLPSPTTNTAVGPTTLDATHYNTITWAAVANADGYKIIRTVGGATQGLIGTVLAGAALTLRDNGLVAQAYVPAGANPSLVAALAGPAEM